MGLPITGNTVAGFRDAGLIELTDSIISDAGLSELSAQTSQSNFEAIYQTSGFGQATSPATLLIQKPIQK